MAAVAESYCFIISDSAFCRRLLIQYRVEHGFLNICFLRATRLVDKWISSTKLQLTRFRDHVSSKVEQ
jgi:hypothetical protein